MADPTYKIIQVVGTSSENYEKAIQAAVVQAKKTLSDLRWFEVIEFRGAIMDDSIQYQATLKLGFKLQD